MRNVSLICSGVIVAAALVAPAADLPSGPGLVGPGPMPPAPPAPLGLAKVMYTTEEIVDLCVQAAMARHHTPGAVAAVALDGALSYEQGYGVRHRQQGGDVEPDTVFRIGSVTKMMTAAALLQQVDRGAVDLRAPVTDYVPEFQPGGRWAGDQVQVRHLLAQTAAYPDNLLELVGPTDDDALTAWVVAEQGVRLHAPPGAFWNYSNSNFALAGLVAERGRGMPYRRLVEDEVWAPAGMTATTFDPATVVGGDNYAWGHFTDPLTGDETIFAPDDYDDGALAPAGYAFSTAGDLVRWALLLMGGGGGVLSPESAAAMQSPQAWTEYTPGAAYGYGVFVERYQGLDICQHGGNVPGWGTYLLWVPEERFAVAVIANTFESLADAAYCIVDRVLEPPGEIPPQQPPLDPTPYLGFYDVVDLYGGELPAHVGLGADGLEIMFFGAGDVYTTPLVHVYYDTFLFDANDDDELDYDLTFINRGLPERTNWARVRYLVGGHQFPPRRGDRR